MSWNSLTLTYNLMKDIVSKPQSSHVVGSIIKIYLLFKNIFSFVEVFSGVIS